MEWLYLKVVNMKLLSLLFDEREKEKESVKSD